METSDHQENNIQQVFRTGEALSAESANRFIDQTIWLNTWLVPLKDASGEVTSVLGVSRDITERKRAEEALQQARDLLEERVTVRTRELMASQEKLRILTAQTITAQEEERRVISRELHDDAGQALITLKYGLAAIQSELPISDTIARQRLSEFDEDHRPDHAAHPGAVSPLAASGIGDRRNRPELAGIIAGK